MANGNNENKKKKKKSMTGAGFFPKKEIGAGMKDKLARGDREARRQISEGFNKSLGFGRRK